jgi:cell division protein FtsB
MSDNKTLKFRPKGQSDNQQEPVEEPIYEVGDDYDHDAEPSTELATAEKPVQQQGAPNGKAPQSEPARKSKATPRPKATPRSASPRSDSGRGSTSWGSGFEDSARTPRSADETIDLSAAKRKLDRADRKAARAAARAPRKDPAADNKAGTVAPAASQEESAASSKPERKAFKPKKAVDLGAAVAWVGERLPKKDPNAPKVPLREKRWPRVAAVVLAIVIALFAFLYPPLKDFYTAKRDGQRYQAQLELLESNNSDLTDRISELQSQEGIMDEARRHGYVVEGETAVEVEGIDDGESDGSAAVAPDSLGTQLPEEERPWYIVALDTIFGYEAS